MMVSALRLLVLGLVFPFAVASASSSAQSQPDWDIPNGHFFTQTGGGGKGYGVTDDGGVKFWSEFTRLGGVPALGYPISQRFEWDGFVVQVFQQVVFQWRPEVGQVYFVNVFDLLDQLGVNEWLLAARQIPPPAHWNETGLAWDEIVRRRLAVLDASPAIRAAYFAVVGDPVQTNGLPTSVITDMSTHYAVRTQRVVFQLWKEDVPWAHQGQVTVALGGQIAKEAGLFPDSAALQPVLWQSGGQPGAQASAPPLPLQRQVLAYYAPWDSASWDSLARQAGAIDYVSAQWVQIDACGNIGSRDDQTLKQFAREQGTTLLPSLLTTSSWLNNRLVTDETTRAHAISQIADYVRAEDYAGFDLDLEGVNADDRAAYTAFVEQLATALHAHGKLLALAIPAKTHDVATGWAAAYDYAALGHHADLVTIMAYDYHGAWGPPGPVAPYDWVDQVAAFATSQIPPHKVMLGLAFYGYDWNITSGFPVRSLKHGQAQWLAERYGVSLTQDPASRSATLRYSAPAGDPTPPGTQVPPQHDITERKLPPCSVTPPPTPPPATPRALPPLAAIQEHVVWIEDATSAAARLELAARYQTRGIATWRLGQEDPRVWEVFQAWRSKR
ncbi:MAG TPA: hypothetical protein DEP84_37810 [Chloroflexi bacterium]|nr:hypothetical protein [Chloroflexota bacterium]